MRRALLILICLGLTHVAAASDYDVLIRGGEVYDGTGAAGRVADVGIAGDTIVAIGDLSSRTAAMQINATGLVVAPGFINMLSWATDSLLIDGRSQSNIRQGVTLEVFGEGMSMGPLNDAMRSGLKARMSEAAYDIPWTSLGGYLEHLTSRGVSPNVASFVGATSVRIHEMGFADRAPTEAELGRMQVLVEEAMLEGAMGLGSSLIYAPAFYAQTDELVALMQTAARYGGMYISHLRSEGNRLLESVDELIEIAERSQAAAEIYHLKLSGRNNWKKYDALIQRIEAARARGLAITTNMYTYTAGSTGLDAAMPPWVQEGGYQEWVRRLKSPQIRARVVAEMTQPTDQWENLLRQAGADQALLVGFKNPQLRSYIGMTLLQVAEMKNSTPAETAIDLVIEDGSRVQVVYFLMSEENVVKQIQLPYMSFGSA